MLAVAMGIGRFAYTPMLPLMHDQAGLSASMAGFLASSNLAGYLSGALAAIAPALRRVRLQTVRGAIVTVILTTAAMAIPLVPVWIVLRFATGVASGFALVLCSSLVLDRAAREGKHGWAGWLYTGVGAGIVLSAVVIPPSAALGGWRAGWLGLALVSALLSAATVAALDDAGEAAPGTAVARPPADRRMFWWLFAAYGGEGLGYIIPATFMVAMFVRTPELAPLANLAWAIVGCVAIPSTFFWNRLGLRLGGGIALAVALVVQGMGTLAPLALRNALGAMLFAIALGGTFMGITTLANALGRQLYPERSQLAIGRLATIFGIGQIAGPLVATGLTLRTGNYDAAIAAAALVLFVSSGLMLAGVVARGRSSSAA